MGFLTNKPASAGSETANVRSEATTVVPSQNVSNTDLAKHPQLEALTAETDPHAQTQEPQEKVIIDATLPSRESSELEIQNQEKHADGVVPSPHDDEAVYPSGVKLALITLALCLSVFLVALDNTIIATAIPKITDHFNSLGDVGWYGSSYLLTTCALQLFFGK